MAFDRIRKVDLVGIGVIGLADTPALSTAEMQKKFEETAREVLMPAHNALVDKLNAEGASHIGAVAPGGLTTTVQGALEALNQAIDDKVQELGAGDMAKAVYDPKGAGVDVTVQTYTHTKSDNVHEFVGTGANGRVLMTDDVEPGDYVTVNGWEVDAYVGADRFADALAGQSLCGRWLTFVFDGTQINFKGGGGAVTVEGLAAENIVAGQTVTVKQGAKTVAQVEGAAPMSTIAAVGGYASSGMAEDSGVAETPTFTVRQDGQYSVVCAAGGYDGGSCTITLSKNGTSQGSKTQYNGYGRHVWTVSCAAGDVLAISYTRTSIYVGINPILTVLIREE